MNLESLWDTIPVGKENAVSYDELCELWGVNARRARGILHQLSMYDNGDDYVLIRSSRVNGFYRTNNQTQITLYRQECLSRGRNTFAPLKKIDRVLNANNEQYSFVNNLRVVREGKGMTQECVCRMISGIDESLLSKMENGVVIPSPYLTQHLARLYGVQAHELISTDLHTFAIYDVQMAQEA